MTTQDDGEAVTTRVVVGQVQVEGAIEGHIEVEDDSGGGISEEVDNGAGDELLEEELLELEGGLEEGEGDEEGDGEDEEGISDDDDEVGTTGAGDDEVVDEGGDSNIKQYKKCIMLYTCICYIRVQEYTCIHTK